MMRGLVVAAILVAGTSAYAQSQKTAAAFAFKKGKELMNAGKVAEACDAFEQSEKLDPQLGTQYNLARCFEQQGRLASAWINYTELAAKDTNAGRRADADKRAQSLEPKLTKMLVRATRAPKGTTVTLDGVDVTMLIGVESPIDAGAHTIVATPPSGAPWSAQIEFAGEGRTVTVDVPAPGEAAKAKPPVAATAKAEPKPAAPAARTAAKPDAKPDDAKPDGMPPAPRAITTPPAPRVAAAEPEPPTGALPSSQDAAHDDHTDADEGLTGVQKVGIAGIVVGVVGASVGAVLLVNASQKPDKARAVCGGPLDGNCGDPQRRATADQLLADQKTLNTEGGVAVGVGAGVLVIGGAMLLFGGNSDAAADKPHTAFAPVIAPDRLGVALTRTF